jgi:hypothetical protein
MVPYYLIGKEPFFMKRITEAQIRQVIREEIINILEGDVIQFPSGRSTTRTASNEPKGDSNVFSFPKSESPVSKPTNNLNLIGISNDKFSNELLVSLVMDAADIYYTDKGFAGKSINDFFEHILARIVNDTKQELSENQKARLDFLIEFAHENGYLEYPIKQIKDHNDPNLVNAYVKRFIKKYGKEPILVKYDGEYRDFTSFNSMLDREYPL